VLAAGSSIESKEGACPEQSYNTHDALRFPLNVGSHDIGFRYMFDFTVAAKSLDLRPGAEVLDFASGSCFVSEWLNRLGYITTALDVDPAILAIGRERLTLDPRCERSVSGRGAGVR
jgi:2-polyprenyl-3-methyl-5-hydroxy-6-metoxy-1,4-benzoquinol methylase